VQLQNNKKHITKSILFQEAQRNGWNQSNIL